MVVLCRVATEDESSTLQQFLVEHYLPNLELFTSLGLSADSKDVADFLAYSLQVGISQQVTVVATNESGEIMGLSVNHSFEDEPKGEPQTSDPEEQASFNTMMAFTNSLQEGFQTLIPADCRRVLLISMLSVGKQFGRQGVGRKLLEASTENAKKKGFDAAIALSVSKASQNLFSKLRYSVLRVVKHEDFISKEGTRLINCKDGTEEGQLVFLNL